jgi:hypothetical protein
MPYAAFFFGLPARFFTADAARLTAHRFFIASARRLRPASVMPQNESDKLGPAGHALTGAGVGAAGVGSSVGLLGLSAAVATLPISLVLGAIGGLIWWAAKKEG